MLRSKVMTIPSSDFIPWLNEKILLNFLTDIMRVTPMKPPANIIRFGIQREKAPGKLKVLRARIHLSVKLKVIFGNFFWRGRCVPRNKYADLLKSPPAPQTIKNGWRFTTNRHTPKHILLILRYWLEHQ